MSDRHIPDLPKNVLSQLLSLKMRYFYKCMLVCFGEKSCVRARFPNVLLHPSVSIHGFNAIIVLLLISLRARSELCVLCVSGNHIFAVP